MVNKLVPSVSLAVMANLGMVWSGHAQTTPQPAAAAPASADESTQRRQLEDIIVTARKRAAGEALQQSPITASALPGETLTRANIVDLRDVGSVVPAVSFQGSSTKGTANFSIRGVGVSGGVTSDSPAVGIFQDGIYWGSNFGALNQLFDLEDVEVLRGPQGTLFGRNVTGGAVVIHSAQPKFEDSARVSLGYGNANSFDATAILNGALSDTVAVRLSTKARSSDGYYHSDFTGGRIGAEKVLLVRPSILFKPSTDFSVIIRGEYYRLRGDAAPTRGYAPSTFVGAAPTRPYLAGYRTPADYYSTDGEPGLHNADVYFLAGEMNWNVGPGVLTWVNGYRDVNFHSIFDADGFPPKYFQSTVRYHQKQVSSELRYAFKLGDLIDLTVGGFYFHQSFDSRSSRIVNSGPVAGGDGKLLYEESFAAFMEGDIKLTDKLKVTLGGRYTQNRLAAQNAPNGSCDPAQLANDVWVCTFSRVGHLSEGAFTPKAGISYQVTRDNLLYASYTKGLRNGGYNLQGAALYSPFAPESVKAYEIGSKNDFFDHRLRLNLAAYYYDYTNIQRTILAVDPIYGSVQNTFNAARARIQGLDLSVSALVTPELRFDIAYGYVDAKFKEYLGLANPGARKFVRVPENTGSVTATYTRQIDNGGELSLRLSAAYSGPYFYDEPNLLRQGGYTLVDGDISYRFPSGHTTLNLWARNIGNAKYSGYGADLGINGQVSFLGQPRTYGIRVTRDF